MQTVWHTWVPADSHEERVVCLEVQPEGKYLGDAAIKNTDQYQAKVSVGISVSHSPKSLAFSSGTNATKTKVVLQAFSRDKDTALRKRIPNML